MKIRLKLSGELEDAVRPELAASYPTDNNISLAAFVASLPFKDRIALTSVNGSMVPPSGRDQCILKEGDTLMILPAIKGG